MLSRGVSGLELEFWSPSSAAAPRGLVSISRNAPCTLFGWVTYVCVCPRAQEVSVEGVQAQAALLFLFI